MKNNRYQCTVCSFEYDSGDQGSASDRLPSFESLLESWRCPACGVLKNLFKKLATENQHQTTSPTKAH